MDIITKIFNWITSLLKKVLQAIQRLIPVVMIGIAIWLGLGLALPLPSWLVGLTGVTAIAGGTANALLALGASFLLAPQETGEVLAKGVEVLGDVAAGIGASVGGVVSSFLTSPGGLLVLGAGLFFLLRDRKSADVPVNPDQVDRLQSGADPLKLQGAS